MHRICLRYSNCLVNKTIDDDNEQDFISFFEIYFNEKSKILRQRDPNKKTLLHRSCEEGRVNITNRLIKMFLEEKLPLDSTDDSGSTPLDLACMQGFDLIEDQFHLNGPKRGGRFCTYRYHIVKALLEVENSLKKKISSLDRQEYKNCTLNSPLHWAIYWGDYDLAELLIRENPLMLFMINKDDEIPFDMCYRSLNKAFYQLSILTIDNLLDIVFEAMIMSNRDLQNISNYFKSKGGSERIDGISQFLQREVEVDLISDICKLFYQGQSKKSSKIFKELKKKRLEINRQDSEKINKRSEYQKILVHDERAILEPKGDLKRAYYFHRIVNWFAYFDRRIQLHELIQNCELNPFKINRSGKSVVHVLAEEGRHELLDSILRMKFGYLDPRKRFSLQKSMLIPTRDYLNTPLHLAAMRGQKQVFRKILEYQLGDVYQLNQRCITPIELAPKSDANQLVDMSYWDNIRIELKRQEDEELRKMLDDKLFEGSYNRITSVNVPYDYALFARCDSLNPSDSIIYKQMLKIQEEYNRDGELLFQLEMAYFNGHTNIDPDNRGVNKLGIFVDPKNKGKNYFALLIKPTNALYSYMADQLDFKLFNTSKGFRQVYVFDGMKEDQYEPLKHYEKQKIIMAILEEEFDLEKYVQNGIVMGHFPIHDYTERRKISEHIRAYFWEMLIDPLVPGHRPRVLIPFLELGLYHGLQNGYYFGFLGLLTAFMIPLGFCGLLFYLYGVLYLGGLNNPLIPIFSIVLCIWSSLFCHSWARREAELTYAYDVHDLKLVEVQRKEFKGIHSVDEITRKVIKYDYWTPTKRRVFVRMNP